MLQSVAEYYRVLQSVSEYYRVFLAHLLGPISGFVSLSFEDSMIFMCCKDDVVFMFIVGHEDTLLLIH